MNQLAMDYSLEQTYLEPDLRAETRQAVELVKAQPTLFRPEFDAWLAANWLLWRRFEAEALKIARRRQHWSARTIIEYLRHETGLREDGEFKVNNNAAPDCARLFAMLYPMYAKLFEFRGRD